jgi:hypothetical protein
MKSRTTERGALLAYAVVCAGCGRIGYDDYLTPDSQPPQASQGDVKVRPKKDASADARTGRDATTTRDHVAPPVDATHHHDATDAPLRRDVADAATDRKTLVTTPEGRMQSTTPPGTTRSHPMRAPSRSTVVS